LTETHKPQRASLLRGTIGLRRSEYSHLFSQRQVWNESATTKQNSEALSNYATIQNIIAIEI
jgi:hypothetical protein